MAMVTTQSTQVASWMALHQTYGLMEKYIDRRVAALGHSLSTAMPLLVLKDAKGPLQMSQLARRLTQEAQSVTSLVDRIEHRGLVRREPSKRDRRVIHIVLTPEGEQAAMELQAALEEGISEILAPLSEGKCETLDKLLAVLRGRGLELVGWPPEALGEKPAE